MHFADERPRPAQSALLSNLSSADNSMIASTCTQIDNTVLGIWHRPAGLYEVVLPSPLAFRHICVCTRKASIDIAAYR